MKKSVKEVKEEFASANLTRKQELCKMYEADERAGVQSLVKQTRKECVKLAAEYERLESMLVYEKKYRSYALICGIDEAGRGPLAGPVAAGAVILPKDSRILYLNDSKQLTPARREELYEEIQKEAVSIGVGIVDAARIDEINILNATYEAMRQAIAQLSPQPDLLLNDAVTIPRVDIPQVPIIKGDAKSLSIAAASVIAKVTRDRMMVAYDKQYPQYGFAKHKGYGTKEHIQKLQEYGPCPLHRRTFIGHFVDVDGEESIQKANYRQRGSYYEEVAASYLKKQGYQILERNYRCPKGEIDLIALDKETLVFIEVKFRKESTAGDPAEAVSGKKQRRILETAKWYLMERKLSFDRPLRFDVVAICGSDVKLYQNAFYAE